MRPLWTLGLLAGVCFASRAYAVPNPHSELPGQTPPTVNTQSKDPSPPQLNQVAFSVDTTKVKKTNPLADFFKMLFQKLFEKLKQLKNKDTVTNPPPTNPQETDDSVQDQIPPSTNPPTNLNPEPASIALMGIGFAGLVYIVRRQRRAA